MGKRWIIYENKVRLKEKVCHKCGVLRPASDYGEVPLDRRYFEGGLYNKCNLCFKTEKKQRGDRGKRSYVVSKAIKEGLVKKPKLCMVCKTAASRIDGHHMDYSRLLDVVWLCRSCHVRYHVGNKAISINIRKKVLEIWETFYDGDLSIYSQPMAV